MQLNNDKPFEAPTISQANGQISFSGNWTKHQIEPIQTQIRHLRLHSGREITIDGSEVTHLDSIGAIIILKIIDRIKKRALTYHIHGFSSDHQTLLDLITQKEEILHKKPLPSVSKTPLLEAIGRTAYLKYNQLKTYFDFLGQFFVMSYHSVTHFSQLQWRSFLNSIDQMGYRALPIIALLSFLVGVVLAYQLGFQLQNYGADAFIVNLIGQAILREFGPLITAIIGAGRTTSALTAQLGTMKINGEIDALQTMGFSSFDILVIPRVVAALVVFPLLTIWANVFGVMGGMIMSKALFNMNYFDFLGRFHHVIDTTTLLVGLSKAPIFGLIISMVGCFQGVKVSKNADSVGTQTTKSVVQAIFLIIIADALFSILYSRLDI
jgi:phospholipid/cholesterol/gamma-HCH transport system permease protein